MKNKNTIENYWHDIDSRLEKLIEDGAVKLPSLKEFDLEQIANDISNEMGPLTFKELPSSHKRFLDNIEIDKYLTPKLLDLAQKFFNYKGIYQINIILLEKLSLELKECIELI